MGEKSKERHRGANPHRGMQGTWAWRPPHPGTWGPRTPELGKSCQGASKNHPVFPEPGEPGPFVPATCSEQGGCEGPAPSLLPSALGALLCETSSSPQQKASPQPLCLETGTYGVLHPQGSTSWSLPPPRITMHVVREHEGIRGVGACLLQQLLGHCNETHETHAALSITTLLVPRGCVPSPTASSWSCSHRRCRRPAVASSCQAGTGPRRWPSQRPRCSFPCGDTSWRPSSRRPEPGTLQRHAVWIWPSAQSSCTIPGCNLGSNHVPPVPIWGPPAFGASHSGLPRRNRP